MNPFESELRSKGLYFCTNDVEQAVQPADGDCTSSRPSSAEEGLALARDDSPTPAPGWYGRTWWNPPIERWRSDTIHTEVQRQEAAASPRALEGRQRVAQGKRGQEPLAPPWVESSNQASPLPPNRMLLGDSGGERVRPASLSNFGILARFCLGFFLSTPLLAQTPVECVRVVSKSIDRQVRLPGELSPYLSVPIYARVAGFVDRVDVDRGSVVKKGQVLATLVAPETETQIAEASSKAQAVQLQRTEAAAKLSAAQSTYNRLKAASQTPGVVAGNDLEVAEKNVEAAEALVNAYEGSIKAAEASVQSLKALEKYLTITAPFDGIITDRTVHPGTLAGPNSGTGGLPLLKLEQLNRLRLTVAVPEAQVGGIVKNARVPFTLPAFPGETFHGTVRRIAHALEPKTRTMAVELDVANPGFRLASGMYAEVLWPVRKERPALLVPPTSIATTTERTFVIRIKNDVAEWVTVSRGAAAGDLVEVYGALQDSDLIARRGTDELREGTRIKVALPKQ